jgi:hypothetical protein
MSTPTSIMNLQQLLGPRLECSNDAYVGGTCRHLNHLPPQNAAQSSINAFLFSKKSVRR